MVCFFLCIVKEKTLFIEMFLFILLLSFVISKSLVQLLKVINLFTKGSSDLPIVKNYKELNSQLCDRR